jgi:DNA-binding XRE family transcriptional regulator
MSRKPHEPTDKDRKQVTLMAGIGLTHDQIAKIIGISDETLRKYYAEELELAAAKMNAQVAQNLYSIATSKGAGAVASAIFWMKSRGGWREVDRREITGANGAPIQLEAKRTIKLDDMDDDTLEQIEQALRIALENKTDQ